MRNEPTLNLIEQLKAAKVTFQDVARELNYNRATIRERFTKPGQFTIAEVHSIARLLRKTPSAVFKTISRDWEQSAGNPSEVGKQTNS